VNKTYTVVAFSGGLDTSYLVAWLKQSRDAAVATVTVDTGGFSADELQAIEARSHQVGADRHITVDGRQETFDRVVRTLIQGNVLRGNVYPLCVSAERVTQAELLVHTAHKLGAGTIAHGCTGAGNDQVRFDVAIRTLAPEMEILAPIREQGVTREQETAWLREQGIPVSETVSTYSINAGMWGTTIGGGVIHDAWNAVPDDAYPSVVAPDQAPEAGVTITLSFQDGIPVALDEESLAGPALIEKLNTLGARHGIGRGVHLGDTILGIKGRIAFEAPAAHILISAHRELEKLVLTRWQMFWKEKLADFYGMLLHEAQIYDPVAGDIEALLASSQTRVLGDVRLSLVKGNILVDGVRSPHSLLDVQAATYGETQDLWSGQDAASFAGIYGLQGRLAAAAAAPAPDTRLAEPGNERQRVNHVSHHP
jgi:argininosuccinate synthase